MVLCHCPKGGGSAYSAAQLQPSRRQSELCSALVPFPNVPPKLRHLGAARARCSNLGSFHLNVDSLSALRGKSLNLLAEKTFTKRSNTLKSPNIPTPNNSRNPSKETAGARLLYRAAAPFSQSRSSTSRSPKCSVRRAAIKSDMLRKTHALKANQKKKEYPWKGRIDSNHTSVYAFK